MSTDAFDIETTYLTREQVREVDRRAIEDYDIPGIVLMENAGRHATDIILAHLRSASDKDDTKLAIVCGRGNNGGDGFVIARHASNAGADVEIFLACDPTRLNGDALTNYRVARKMNIAMFAFSSESEIEAHQAKLGNADAVVDAVLGTGFSGDVREPLDRVIQAINSVDAVRFAIDVPSGLDCDSGQPSNATVSADATITFVAQKQGFRADAALVHLGHVYVADIGAPRSIVESILKP